MQDSWAKEYTAAAAVIAMQGDRMLKMLERMEADGVEITGNLLRTAFEGIVHEEDVSSVLTVLESKTKLTADLLRRVCNDIKEERWWRWAVLHPELQADRIHETRSMPPYVYGPSSPYHCCSLSRWH